MSAETAQISASSAVQLNDGWTNSSFLFPLSCNFTREADCMLLETFVLLITTLRANAGSTFMQLPKICTRKQTPTYYLCPPLADLNDDYYGHCIPLKSAVGTTLASSSGLSEPRPHHLQVSKLYNTYMIRATRKRSKRRGSRLPKRPNHPAGQSLFSLRFGSFGYNMIDVWEFD